MVSLAISFICTTQLEAPMTVLRVPTRGAKTVESTGQFEPESGPKSGIHFTTNQAAIVASAGDSTQ